ncbi:hypothetical protein [Marinimicrobium locisalis]
MKGQEKLEDQKKESDNEVRDITDITDDELMDMDLEIEPGPETALFWQ